jgi:hypothetical protein
MTPTHLNIKSAAKAPAHNTGLLSFAPTRLQAIRPNKKALYWKCIESRMRKPGCKAMDSPMILSYLPDPGPLASLYVRSIARSMDSDELPNLPKSDSPQNAKQQY